MGTEETPAVGRRLRLALLTAAVAFVAGSGTMPQEVSRSDPSNRETVDDRFNDDQVLFTNTQDDVDPGVVDDELYEGSGTFIDEERAVCEVGDLFGFGLGVEFR